MFRSIILLSTAIALPFSSHATTQLSPDSSHCTGEISQLTLTGDTLTCTSNQTINGVEISYPSSVVIRADVVDSALPRGNSLYAPDTRLLNNAPIATPINWEGFNITLNPGGVLFISDPLNSTVLNRIFPPNFAEGGQLVIVNSGGIQLTSDLTNDTPIYVLSAPEASSSVLLLLGISLLGLRHLPTSRRQS